MRDDLLTIMHRMDLSRTGLALLLDLPPQHISAYLSERPIRKPPIALQLRVGELALSDKWDVSLLAKVPTEARKRGRGRPFGSTSGKKLVEVSNPKIRAFMRRWNVSTPDVADWLGYSSESVRAWKSDTRQMPEKSVEKLQLFSGNTFVFSERLKTARGVYINSFLLGRLNWKQQEMPSPPHLMTGYLDFYQPALLRAVFTPIRDDLMNRIFECRRALFAFERNPHSELISGAYWRERWAVEKMLLPFVQAEGYDEHYNVAED